jgi:hypothetical protein
MVAVSQAAYKSCHARDDLGHLLNFARCKFGHDLM